MKHIHIYISTLLLTAAITGCSQQDSWDNDTANGKEQVMFSSGISQSNVVSETRTATGGDYLAFTKENTKMKLYASATWKGHGDSGSDVVIKTVDASLSDKKTRDTNHGYNDITTPLYWDDFGAGDLSNCETTGDLTTTKIAKEGMTVYGIAVDGGALPTRFANISYSGLTSVADNVPTDQSAGISTEDVVISNNISKTGDIDNRFTYVKPSNTNVKELEFRHIYNKITLNFKHGNGFTSNLPPAMAVTLPGYNVKGKLNITTGAYTFTTGDAGTVTKLHATTATTGYERTYEALTLPGRVFTETGTDDVLTFEFSGNTYKVSSAEIYKVLKANGDEEFTTMKSGVHYILNITVNLTDVKLTATIADWTTVEGALTPSNGQVVNFAGLTNNFATGFNLYIAQTLKDNTAYNDASSKTGYAEPVTFNWVEASELGEAHYDYADASKTIYWPNNGTYYHFRGLANATLEVDATNGDYVTLTTKQTTSADNTYADVIWGAPYTTATPAAISPALGPTSNKISLEFFHKMAEVKFIFQTTEGSDKVDLSTAPTVVLNCVSSGKVLMQDGTITPGTEKSDYTLSAASGSTTVFEKVGVVPQSTAGLTLAITTADGNVYPISDLSKIKVTGTSTLINEWKEGTKYVYTITLKKSGVEITAQIKDWDTVTAGNETIVIQ